MKPYCLLIIFYNMCFVSLAQYKVASENSKKLTNTARPVNLPTKNTGYDFSTVKTCIDIPPPLNALPPRAASNAYTIYKINMDETISYVAVQRQPLAATTDKIWTPGETIKFGFDIRGGSISLIEKVKYYQVFVPSLYIKAGLQEKIRYRI